MGNLTAKSVEHASRGKHSDGDGSVGCQTERSTQLGSPRERGGPQARHRDRAVAGGGTCRGKATTRRDQGRARAGRDPTTLRSDVPTFGQAAERVCDMMRPTWRDPRHGDIWPRPLRKHAAPLWHMRADRITRADVLAILHPIWHSKPRLRGEYARASAKCSAGSWPTTSMSSPTRQGRGSTQHFRALRKSPVTNAQSPTTTCPMPCARIEHSEASLASKLCLQFLILTGVRSGEARGARWSEVDIDGAPGRSPPNA